MPEQRSSELRERFYTKLRAQAAKVRALAQAGGEPGALRRALAVELLSITGGATVFGVSSARGIAGELGELLACSDAELGTSFSQSFGSWFARYAEYLISRSQGRASSVTAEALSQERGRLEQQVRGDLHSRSELPTSPPRDRRRVLFIDDSATARAVVVATLGEHGYNARAAGDLRETAVQLLDFQPELVVSDVQLGSLDGDQLCRHLKQNMRRAVPVVLYSSLPEAELVRRAKAACAEGFVTKQDGLPQLLKCIERLLARENST